MPTTLGQAGQHTVTAESVLNSLRQSRGNFSNTVYARICAVDPFFKHISTEKMAFPSQKGDTYEREVMHVTTPNETDLGAWTEIRKAGPGYNPSADSYEDMLQYGSSKQSCRLFRKGFRTPNFNKISLAITHDRDQQLANVKEALITHTLGIWPAWARRSFRRSVTCRTLNGTYGHMAENDGGYLAGITPDSLLTHGGLEMMLPGIMSTPTISDTPGMKLMSNIPDQVVFMGYQEFTALEQQYQNSIFSKGFRAPDVTVPELGLTGKKIGKYLFILENFPTRFRAPVGDETWEDCIVPHTIKVPTTGGAVVGYKDAANPAYYDPSIALYSEAKVYNVGSVIWFTPPADVLKGMKSNEVFQFPVSTYTGEFFPVNLATREDPEAENIFFAAKYMAGMMGANPGRSRCVLALAAHPVHEAYTLTGVVPGTVGEFFARPVQIASVHPNGNLLLFIAGTLPTTPPGHSLWIVRSDGTKYLVASIESTTVTAGNSEVAAGVTLEIIMDDTAQQAIDPESWTKINCLKDLA